MGLQAVCCQSKKRQDSYAEETPGCFSRMTGKYDEIDEYGEQRFKALSFYDYNEDKKNLLESTANDGLDFDDSEMDSASEYQSVDEGAVAVLSMDEIRKMK